MVLCRWTVIEVVNQHSSTFPVPSPAVYFFASALFDFRVTAQHTPGATNIEADALSRTNLHLFFVQVLRALLTPHSHSARSATAAESGASRLNFADLVRLFLQNALAPSTRRTYQSALSFCSLFHLPFSQDTLMKFVAWLAWLHVRQYGVEPGIEARHIEIIYLPGRVLSTTSIQQACAWQSYVGKLPALTFIQLIYTASTLYFIFTRSPAFSHAY